MARPSSATTGPSASPEPAILSRRRVHTLADLLRIVPVTVDPNDVVLEGEGQYLGVDAEWATPATAGQLDALRDREILARKSQRQKDFAMLAYLKATYEDA